jgi:aspartate/methionine/tyrosine aminotransferase
VLLAGDLMCDGQIITLNNPHNPTGTAFPSSVVAEIVAFAKQRNIVILSDEIYRPLFHSLPAGQEAPPSILSFGYNKVVSTSSTSKCFSLAGLRLGWIATRDKAIHQAVAHAREYTTISVSRLDDQVGAYAFSASVLPNLVARNTALARTNLALLESFINKYGKYCSWVKPTAGTMAFVEIKKSNGELVDDVAFCLDVLGKTKALMVPGSLAFGRGEDFKGFVRIGYACHTAILQEALEQIGEYMEKHL